MVLANRAAAAYHRSMLLAPDVAPPPAIIRAHCPAGYAHVRCGFVRVPLDHQNPTGPTIRVYFERYLRRDRRDPATTTVVAIEGGPGYATTGSRDSYQALWRPVSQHRDLLLVDLRGTGRSGALACKAFANHVTNYNVRAGRCATQLGPRRRFYDTSQSVQDIASVLRAIRAGPVDLYGDSYGSYAAQAFSVRYPHRLRSLVLDSTYPVPGTDPAFADLALRSREAMRLACSRWPDCPVSDPVSQLRGLVQSVRADPIVGNAPDGDGTRQHVVVDERTLATTIQVIYGNLGVLRDLPAAIASSRASDNRPLPRALTTATGPPVTAMSSVATPGISQAGIACAAIVAGLLAIDCGAAAEGGGGVDVAVDVDALGIGSADDGADVGAHQEQESRLLRNFEVLGDVAQREHDDQVEDRCRAAEEEHQAKNRLPV